MSKVWQDLYYRSFQKYKFIELYNYFEVGINSINNWTCETLHLKLTSISLLTKLRKYSRSLNNACIQSHYNIFLTVPLNSECIESAETRNSNKLCELDGNCITSSQIFVISFRSKAIQLYPKLQNFVISFIFLHEWLNIKVKMEVQNFLVEFFFVFHYIIVA